MNEFTAVILSDNAIDCIYDDLHSSTSSINSYFQQRELERSEILIISYLLIDVLLLHFQLNLLFWGPKMCEVDKRYVDYISDEGIYLGFSSLAVSSTHL